MISIKPMDRGAVRQNQQCSEILSWDTSKFTSRKIHNPFKDPCKCLKGSSYWVEGEPYCKMHAGKYALIALVDVTDT